MVSSGVLREGRTKFVRQESEPRGNTEIPERSTEFLTKPFFSVLSVAEPTRRKGIYLPPHICLRLNPPNHDSALSPRTLPGKGALNCARSSAVNSRTRQHWLA